MCLQQELKVHPKHSIPLKEYHSSAPCHQHGSSDTKDIPQRFPEDKTENIFT